MAIYKVAEKFESINGEGVLAGQLAVFIRFCGCNLKCDYCDTKWANKPNAKYTLMSETEIYDYIKQTGIKNVTLTGGEPLLQKDIKVLIELLAKDRDLKVEIETNGSIDLKEFLYIENRPAFTMDYKLSCSGMEKFMNMDNFKCLDKKDTLKFVVGNISDLERAREVITSNQLIEQCNIYISPVYGQIELESIVDFMKKNNLNGVTMQVQLHKIIWNPDKRGV